MLETLLGCSTLDDISNVGAQLLSDSELRKLQNDIRKERLVFARDSYWEDDRLSMYSAPELIAMTRGESLSDKVLHMLQVLQRYCPAVSQTIGKLLQRTTC